MNELNGTRRSFLYAVGGLSATAWLASGWGEIAAAADHAAQVATTTPGKFEFLIAEDAADVDALVAQILPSGPSPGARDAHAVYFIDRALATFFCGRAPAFRAGLAEFRRSFRMAHPTVASFAAAIPGDQAAFLTTVQHTGFFESVRVLTIVGTLSLGQYGGNFEGIGWKLMGFEDKHVFSPPFGYYDRRYTGFTPGHLGDEA